jgi:hypothetical protein
MDLRVKPEDDGRLCRDRNKTETDCLNLMTLGSEFAMTGIDWFGWLEIMPEQHDAGALSRSSGEF